MVTVSKYYSKVVRQGTRPTNDGNAETDPLDPINPVNPSTGSRSYLTLTDTVDNTYNGKNGFVPVVTNEQGLTLQPLPDFEEYRLISGGVVQWTGTGYVFNVSGAFYKIAGVLYQSDPDQVTLGTPDVTNNRIDVIAVDNTGSVVVIAGTAAASPVKPQVDPATQLELTSILVIASSTEPTLTEEVVYDENTEWTGSSSGTGTVAFNSAVDPYQGTLSIETTNIENGLKVRLTDGSDFDISTVQTLGFQIKLKAELFAGQNIGLTILDSSGDPVSNQKILNVNKTDLAYQFVGIALNSFTLTSTTIRAIEFEFIRTRGQTVHDGFFLDIIKFEGGINPPVTIGSFLGLSDTPGTYSGQAGLFPRVNVGETALEFDSVSPYDLDQEGATDGQVLTWVTANSRYEPVTPSGESGGGGTDANAVHYNTDDGASATEKAQARSNIGSTASTPQIVTTTGTINDLAYTSNCIVFTGGAAVTLAGLVAGQDGEEVCIVNYTNTDLKIDNNGLGSTAANRFRGELDIQRFGVSAIVKYRTTLNRWVVQDRGLFYSNTANGFRTDNAIGFNIDPTASIALNVASNTTTTASTALLCRDSAGTQLLNVNGGGNVNAVQQFTAGATTLAAANVSFTARGKGTTTGTTAEFYDSSANINIRFRDDGNIDIYNMPTSDPLVAGRLWNDSGTVKISAG